MKTNIVLNYLDGITLERMVKEKGHLKKRLMNIEINAALVYLLLLQLD